MQLPSDSEPQMPGSMSHSFMSERDREKKRERERGEREKERDILILSAFSTVFCCEVINDAGRLLLV